MRYLISALLLATVPNAPSFARDAIRLEPTSKWHLNYAEDSCRLARKFGEGNDEVLLFLDQFVPGDHFHMILGGNLIRPRTTRVPMNVSLRFGPNEKAIQTRVDTGEIGNQRALIFHAERIAPLSEADSRLIERGRMAGVSVALPPIGAAREAAVRWLEIDGATWDALVLETGPMDRALESLRKCSWDTVKSWGLDVEQQKTLSRGTVPTKGPETWFSASDYPDRLVRDGIQGIINFRLIIDETGKPASCHIQMSTRPKEFDETVCQVVMKRARFSPALDASGKPVPSFWRQTVQFRMQ